jgi:hypothetical protein
VSRAAAKATSRPTPTEAVAKSKPSRPAPPEAVAKSKPSRPTPTEAAAKSKSRPKPTEVDLGNVAEHFPFIHKSVIPILACVPPELAPPPTAKGKFNYRVTNSRGDTTVEVQLKHQVYRIIKSAKTWEGGLCVSFKNGQEHVAWADVKERTGW